MKDRITQQVQLRHDLSLVGDFNLSVEEDELLVLQQLIPVLFKPNSPFRIRASEAASKVLIEMVIRQVREVCPSATLVSDDGHEREITTQWIGATEVR